MLLRYPGLFVALAVGALLAPEQPGSAQRAELLQRSARGVQQRIARALARETLELVVDGAQIPRQGVQPLAGFREPRPERLFVLRAYDVHVIP